MNAKPKDPFLRRYSIGDFAKKAGVSTHFLKFYEEKGILHPKVQENGYRHYDIRDASVVLECRRMKNMGLSVKEIEKAINDSTPAETEQLLAQQQNVLEEQLWQQQMHLQGLQNLRAALRFCQQQEWSVRTAPDIWFLPHTMDREFLQEEGIYRQLPQWLEWMPLVTSAQMITALPEGRLRAEWGLGVEVQQAQQIRLAPDAPARLVQQGRVLEIYGFWQVTENGQNEAQMYRTCMDRAAALNLIPEPMVYRTVFCYTEKAGLRQMHCMLRVAVKAPR